MSESRPPKPDTLDVDPDGVPEALKARDQWVLWSLTWKADREEWTKIPKQPTGAHASSTDADTWSSFVDVLARYQEGGYDGIGFVLSEDGLVAGVDLDDCRDPDTGAVAEWAEGVVDELDTYAEVSPSGTGAHALGFGFLPDGGNRDDVDGEEGHIEMYDDGRYLTVTGQRLDGSTADLCRFNDELESVHTEYIADDEPEEVETINCRDCDGKAHLASTSEGEDLADDVAIEKVKTYLCPDCAASVAEVKEGGEWSLNWDKEVSTDVVRQMLDKKGVAYDTEQTGSTDTDPTRNGSVSGSGDVDLDDDELIERAKSAENGDKFERLWNGRTTGYESHSEARLAFANILAFWTGGDEKRMLKLFKRSDLYRGEDDERTWTEYEAPKANSGRTEYYDPSEHSGESPAAPDDESDESGATVSPPGLMEKAFSDPYGRLSRNEDGPDPTIHDLRSAEAASYLWDVLEDRGEVDVMSVSDGSFRAFRNGIWKREGNAGEQQLREYGERALRSKYSSKVLEQLKEKTRSRNRYGVDELGIAEPWIVANGEALNMKTRETRPVERDDLALRSINAEYDPDAEPDLWLDFLSRVAATPETIDKVQEYFGYCLWVHGQPFGKGLFLIGDTDSGKGTALKVLSDILGKRENVANESLTDLLETRWGKASLHGRMVNIRNEVTPGALNNVEDFKELLGGEDTVTAERKGQQKFEFTVRQKFAFATNQFPEIENADNAFWNRCLFARFPETIPEDEQRPGFHDDLLDERSGILNWMLDGLNRLLEQEHFTGERSFDEKRNIAEEVGSPLERLKQDGLKITREPTHMVHARDLYDLAKAYAEDVGMDSGIPAWNGGAFTTALREWPGIETGRTRKFDESGDSSTFRGVRVDPDLAHRLGVEVRQLDETPSGQTGLDV